MNHDHHEIHHHKHKKRRRQSKFDKIKEAAIKFVNSKRKNTPRILMKERSIYEDEKSIFDFQKNLKSTLKNVYNTEMNHQIQFGKIENQEGPDR